MDPKLRSETAAPPAVAASRRTGPMARLAVWAVIAQVVLIAAGNNELVSQKVFSWTGSLEPNPGFARQLAYSTQALAWRIAPASHESTSEYVATLVRIVVTVVLTGLLVWIVVRGSSFWRTWISTVVIVVFSAQVGAVVSAMVYGGDTFTRSYLDYLPVTADSGFLGSSQTSPPSYGGTGFTDALFGTGTGYRFVGGLILGALVGIVVGAVARRVGDAGSSDPFFTPGSLQRMYEANRIAPVEPPYPAPGAPAPGTPVPPIDLSEPDPGRHARDVPDSSGS